MKRPRLDIAGAWHELQRRRVVRLGLWYIAFGVAAIQAADVLLGTFERGSYMPCFTCRPGPPSPRPLSGHAAWRDRGDNIAVSVDWEQAFATGHILAAVAARARPCTRLARFATGLVRNTSASWSSSSNLDGPA